MKLDDLKPNVDQSSNVSASPAKQKEYAFPWASLAKILATVGTVGGLLLHLVGHIAHESYLTAWGIDPGLFPKPVDDIVMTGYLAVMDRSVSILTVLETEGRKLFWPGIALTAYVYVILRLSRSDKREKTLRVLQRVPHWTSDLAKSLVATAIVLAGFPVALVLALMFMMIPAVFGDTFGHSLAEKEYKAYLSGCKQSIRNNKCFELRKDGKSLAHGFLIDSSQTHIALFDINEMRARALERAGTEFLAYEPHKVIKPDTNNIPRERSN